MMAAAGGRRPPECPQSDRPLPPSVGGRRLHPSVLDGVSSILGVETPYSSVPVSLGADRPVDFRFHQRREPNPSANTSPPCLSKSLPRTPRTVLWLGHRLPPPCLLFRAKSSRNDARRPPSRLPAALNRISTPFWDCSLLGRRRLVAGLPRKAPQSHLTSSITPHARWPAGVNLVFLRISWGHTAAMCPLCRAPASHEIHRNTRKDQHESDPGGGRCET